MCSFLKIIRCLGWVNAFFTVRMDSRQTWFSFLKMTSFHYQKWHLFSFEINVIAFVEKRCFFINGRRHNNYLFTSNMFSITEDINYLYSRCLVFIQFWYFYLFWMCILCFDMVSMFNDDFLQSERGGVGVLKQVLDGFSVRIIVYSWSFCVPAAARFARSAHLFRLARVGVAFLTFNWY